MTGPDLKNIEQALEALENDTETNIDEQKQELLDILGSISSSIQKSIPRPTRIENANKKIDLLISFILKFIERIKELNPKEYKLYTVKEERTPTAFAITKRGNENIGNKFLGRKYEIQELESKRSDILEQLETIKSRLNICSRLIVAIDPNNDNKEEKEAFDELTEKITIQEDAFLKIYDTFTRSIIPQHIATEINTEELYQQEDIKTKVKEYFRGKYPGNKENETIPDGIDPNSLEFQERLYHYKGKLEKYIPTLQPIPFSEKGPVESPLHLENIQYIPIQYPTYEFLSYPNPEYKEAQKLLKKHIK